MIQRSAVAALLSRFLGIVLAFTASAEAFAQCGGTFGAVVGQFDGVTAYSNGTTSCVSNQSSYVDGKYMGMKWQCVEYVRRFYWVSKGRYLGALGNANTWYENGQGLYKHPNQGTQKPRVGDILCSASNDYGHVAVIREVGSDYIAVIHQNWSNSAADNRYVISMSVSNGHYSVSSASGYVWQGWLSEFSDDEPPVVAWTGIAADRWYKSGTISWNITDSGGSGVDGYASKWGSAPTSMTNSGSSGSRSISTAPSQGMHSLYVRAWDNAGNIGNKNAEYGFDTTLPITVLQSSSAPTGSWLRGSGLQAKWTSSDQHSGFRRHRYRWNSGAWSSYSSNEDGTATLLEGKNTLSVDAEDKAYTGSTYDGNKRTTTFEFWLDNGLPHVDSFSFDPASPSNASAVSINVSATDALSGVERIVVQIDGQVVRTFGGASGIYTWQTESYSEGPHEVVVTAFDVAGNSDSVVSTYVLDRTSPEVSLALSPADPDGLDGWYISQPTATLFASDPMSGVATIWYRVDNGAPTQYAGPFAISGDGEIEISVWAIDNAGNASAPQIQLVKVDLSPPDQPVLEDEGALTGSRSVLNVTLLNGGDPDSGITMIEYRVGTVDRPDLWRADTQVATRDPYLFAQGLYIPVGETAIVELRVRNGAGLWSEWATTDGIVVDPDNWPLLVAQNVAASGGLSSNHPDVSLGATISETIVGDAFHPDVDLRSGFWSTLLAYMRFVQPNGFSLVRGVLAGGGLQELLESDDQWLRVAAGVVLNQGESPVQVLINGTSPVETPRELRVKLESFVNSPGISWRIELYNFVNDQFEVINSGNATTVESVVEVGVSTDVSRFIEPGTKMIRAKVSFMGSGLTLVWPWTVSLDQVLFKVKR